MKLLPSASYSRAPFARSTKSGEPPTAFHARTGELTAPGMIALARINRSLDLFTVSIDYSPNAGCDRRCWELADIRSRIRHRFVSLRQIPNLAPRATVRKIAISPSSQEFLV